MTAQTSVVPRGRATLLNIKGQPDLQTAATGADAVQLNTLQRTFNKKRPLEDSQVNGVTGAINSTDDRPAEPGLEDGDGSLVLPFDLHQIGYMLTMALGNPVSVAVGGGAPAGTFAHTYASGGDTIPIVTLEGQNAPGQLEALVGGYLKDFSLPIGSTAGYAQVPVTLGGRQTTDPYTASLFTDPEVLALARRVPNVRGFVSIGGVQVARVTQGSTKVTNRTDAERYSENLISAVYLDGRSAEINATVRYTTDQVRTFGKTGADGVLPDAFEVSFTWALTQYVKLVLTFPAVRFEPVGVAIQNGDKWTVDLKGRAEIGAAAPMVTAVLTNQTAEYVL